MNKFIYTLLFCMIATFSYAQTNQNRTKVKDSFQELNLSTEQISKIKQLKQEYGPQYSAISQDNSLTATQKAQRKNDLAAKHQQEMEKILTPAQVSMWKSKYGDRSPLERMGSTLSDEYDSRIDMMETKYKTQKEAIENDMTISKDERDAKIKALKDSYKSDKENLKKEKDRVKDMLK